MPNRIKHKCNKIGCPNLTTERFCDACREKELKREQQQYDRRRGSAHKRGYTRDWGKYSKWRIANIEPFCRQCRRFGEVTDHITPVDGPDDPLFWEESDHQTLCNHCHNVKRATEDKKRKEVL